MKTVFEHKPDFTFREFAVEKTVTIPARKLEEMLRHPMRNHEAIVENAGVMGVDGDGVYHCLLVTGEGRADGLLVESEGSGCARYASYVPEGHSTAVPYALKAEPGAGGGRGCHHCRGRQPSHRGELDGQL